jgi:H/ACA ribonucleoprotein complex subunit 4
MDINKIKQHTRAYPETFYMTQKNPKMFTKGKSIKELLEFGIINIDKSSGPTSFNVSEFVKKKLGLRKTSHFGTLDPKVTGVLPVALNRACKLTGYFLGEDKEYIGIMRMHEDISMKDIEKVIKKKFIGKIIQLPPVKSRVKRAEREREIKSFELLEQDSSGKDIMFKSEVQGGTYIRKLIDDLGKELNIGAHMLELRRVRAGIFKENTITNLYDFEKAVDAYEKGNEELLRAIIIPAEIVSEVYPIVEIKKDNLTQIFTGKPIHKVDVIGEPSSKDTASPKTLSTSDSGEPKVQQEDVVSVFCGERFVGMYKVIDGIDIFAKSEFVMQPTPATQ